MVDRTRAKIMICGDLHNLGDLKLLLQNLSLERSPAFVRIWAPLPEAIIRQIEAAGGTPISGRAILRFARFCFGADVIVGGGQIVRDNVSLRSLTGLLMLILSARAGGGRVVTRGLGISHIGSPMRRWLWAAVLRCCESIRVRDASSAAHASALSDPARIHRTSDMVFLKTEHDEPSPRGDCQGTHILIAPCIDSTEDRSIQGVMTTRLIQAAIDALPECTVLVACHDPRPEMDGSAARRIVDLLSHLTIDVIDTFELSALMQAYRNASVVVTNRLHSLIFSILTETPVIVIDDGNPKLQSFAADFDVPSVSGGIDLGSTVARTLIDKAISFDRASRRAKRDAMHKLAMANLDAGSEVTHLARRHENVLA